MTKLAMCRICLVDDVRMHRVMDTNLQETYEILTGTLLDTKDNRPSKVCYMCCARLRNCYQLRSACARSEELFAQMLHENTSKPPQLQYMKMLQQVHTPITHMSIDPVVSKCGNIGLKDDPAAMIYDVPVKEEYLEGQEDIKTEDVSSEDNMLSHKIKEETSSDNDHSLQDDTILINSSETKHEISSIDVHICTPVVSNPKIIDQEDTAPSTRASMVENETMLKSDDNIAIVNKNIVGTSSKVCASHEVNTLTYVRTQNGAKHYRCDICGTSFSEKPYVCGTCERCFSAKKSLLRHLRTHAAEKPFKCARCGKGFITKAILINHTRTHTGEKPHECMTCGRCFSEKSNLLRHNRIHTDANPLKPNTQTVKSKVILTSPIRTDTSEKPHVCGTCEKCFSRKGDLSRHIRTHTGETPYKCDICGKGFISKVVLIKHIYKHTGETPYKCDICGKGFNTNYDKLRHTRTHTGEKPYQCGTCRRNFSEKCSLLRHLRTHRDDKPYK